MDGVEVYMLKDALWYTAEGGEAVRVDETCTEFIDYVLGLIEECYPEAYEALSVWYHKSASSVPYYRYLMVRRFCRCNFGVLDATRTDISVGGRMSFEHVPCPLRGECKLEGVVCGAKYCNALSRSERRVMLLIYKGVGVQEIADRLYLSPHTVKNHIRSSYAKLGVHERAEFVRLASDTNLFGDGELEA